MGFWDKFEKMMDAFVEGAEKIEKKAEAFEKRANDFLDKNFPDEEPRKAAQQTYTAQQLLSMAKENAKRMAESRLLAGLKELNSTTTRMRRCEGEGSYSGLDIATAKIEPVTSELDPRLAETQYVVSLKGIVFGENDYGDLSAEGKYDIEIIIDEYTECAVKRVDVRRRW